MISLPPPPPPVNPNESTEHSRARVNPSVGARAGGGGGGNNDELMSSLLVVVGVRVSWGSMRPAHNTACGCGSGSDQAL